MKLKVKVTQEHIDQAKRGDCCYCPIALAVRKHGYQTPFVGVVTIYPHGVDIHGNFNLPFKAARMPLEAVDFARNFDYGREVEPFEFEVEIK